MVYTVLCINWVLQALIACKLYKSMAHEAAQDDLEIDISEEIKGHARLVFCICCIGNDEERSIWKVCFLSKSDHNMHQVLQHNSKNMEDFTCGGVHCVIWRHLFHSSSTLCCSLSELVVIVKRSVVVPFIG